MPTLTTGKVAEVMFEKAMETHEEQMQMLGTTEFHAPDGGSMQNSGNIIWYPIQQYAPVIDGWVVTGEETGIIEETYPATLGVPKNDFVQLRADDLRDQRFWERRARESGRQQATELNKLIARAVALQGSLFYSSNASSGYDFIAEAQVIMNERQLPTTNRYFYINDRDNLKFGEDLAARQTLQGRPEKTWATGQIGQNVAQFDIYAASFLPNLIGGTDPVTPITVATEPHFKPEAGSVNEVTGVVTNIDYRSAELTVDEYTTENYNVGDKITISNGIEVIESIGLSDKNPTGQPMTFTIVEIPAGTTATTIRISPKPIALDDTAELSTLELAYANISTRILVDATLNRVNTEASNKTNLFWDKSAVEVLGGTIPANLFAQYDGMKVITDTMKNGQQLYMVYDGNLETMTFRFRLFTWYGITVCNPSLCGVALTE